MTLKEFLIGGFQMLTFQSVTGYDRWFEIALGIMGWLFLSVTVFTTIILIKGL